jgi:hypothetical protein
MRRFLGFVAAFASCATIAAQPAVLELVGVMGERSTPYVALNDELRLHKRPNLQSERVVIPYKKGWGVPATGRDGVTRVLAIGELRVTVPDDRMICSVEPAVGPASLVGGEAVDFLRYVGEGYGEVRFRGAVCQAQVATDLGHFDLIRSPVVQAWLRVYYADGTSPGWLLHDGTQVR